MGGQITGNKTLDTALILAGTAAAIYFTAGAATPAVAPAAGAALGGGTAAGAGVGAGAAGLTGAELGALTASSGAGLGLTGAELGAGFTAGAAPYSLLLPEVTAAAPMSSYLPTGSQLMTGAVGVNAGKQLFFPPSPKLSAPGPVLPSSGSTGRYTPVASAPAQQLAQLMAARRQASGQRRFA